jgi:hypothetical protein
MAQEEMKVDEGYSGGSEETRSLSDSDSTMHIDPVDGHVSKSSTPTLESMLSGVLSLPPAQRSAFITSLLQLLPESERYGICIIQSYPSTQHPSNVVQKPPIQLYARFALRPSHP